MKGAAPRYVDFKAATIATDEFAIFLPKTALIQSRAIGPVSIGSRIPSRRRAPRIPLFQIHPGRQQDGLLVPGMPGRYRTAQRIGLIPLAIPLLVVK
ncbi:MAG: hypothetical protein IPG76_23950 [Acidobacteria bacterium]|nr:hypothetical protein [Acidobacteriota bacterium]